MGIALQIGEAGTEGTESPAFACYIYSDANLNEKLFQISTIPYFLQNIYPENRIVKLFAVPCYRCQLDYDVTRFPDVVCLGKFPEMIDYRGNIP
jgi:hypothetical protein